MLTFTPSVERSGDPTLRKPTQTSSWKAPGADPPSHPPEVCSFPLSAAAAADPRRHQPLSDDLPDRHEPVIADLGRANGTLRRAGQFRAIVHRRQILELAVGDVSTIALRGSSRDGSRYRGRPAPSRVSIQEVFFST